MDPIQETENPDPSLDLAGEDGGDDATSVDDFIRELEAKEKDLHITAETTFIEIAADFDDEDDIPDFMRPDPAEGKVSVQPAVPSTGADAATVKKLEAEIATLKARLAGLDEERAELLQNSHRRLKDFEAYKARTERERGDTFRRQLSNLATQMLPALDNLDRALQFAAAMTDEKQSEFAQFFDGIVLVNQQVHEVLVDMGIDPIQTVGHEFDPHLHEAVAVDESSDLPPNTITAELLRGFRIGDAVIRHSMVKVSKPAPAADPPVEITNESEEPDEDPGTETFDPEVQEDDFEIERNGES